MRLVFAALLTLAPALRAQRLDSLPTMPAGLAIPRGPAPLARFSDLSQRPSCNCPALHRSPVASLPLSPATDTLAAGPRPGHTVVGTLLGIALGAAAGYLVAIPRVHAIENRPQHDGPFQQIEYVLDPAIGGIIGGILGGVVGSRVP